MKLKDAARAFLRAVARVLRLLGRILHISLRVVGWLFVLAVLALGGLGCYAYRHFSPQETKRLAAEQLTSLLRREVVIDRLVLSPSGIKVLGLRVRRGGSEPDFLDCGSALVTVRLKPLLDKRVEIDKVRLEAPQIALLRDASGHWDVTDLFASTPTARGTEDETIPQMLATADVVVTDGVLRIEDREHGRTLNFEQLAMNFDRFSLKRAIPVQAAFVTRTRVGKRDIEARVSAEGSVDLASLNMSSASARVERFSGELQGVPLTGAVDIRGFLNPRVEGRFTAPPLAGEQWRRLFARDFPLTLPASRWRFKGGMPAAGMVDLQSVRVETDEGSAAASGVFDFAAADPTLSVEATFSDIPLGSVAERWPPWAKYALAGKATLRVDVTGWPGRLQAREADLSLHGFGATWGSRSVEGADLDLSATDEFAHVKATVFRGRVSAIGHVFDGVSGAAAIDGRALTVDRLVLNLEGAHLKLRGKMDKFFDPKGGAKVSAPKEVLLSGTADKIDWEKAAKFVLDVRAAISTRTATAADTEESKPWLRTFKYSIPRGFPNTTGSVKVGEIVHPNFTCKNLELLWSLHGITPELNKLNGEAYLSFGPGHVKDLATAQDANTFMRLVFLPFVYMYQMNGKAQLRSVYPKTFDFDRIDGEYGAANGVATIRYFHVGGPQFVAFAQGTADGGRETVDMNILTRLTSFSGLLPDFWLDELGRAAIGFSVKGDINKPDVEPRFKPKIGEKEIEQDVEAGRANAKKRFMALERRLNF